MVFWEWNLVIKCSIFQFLAFLWVIGLIFSEKDPFLEFSIFQESHLHIAVFIFCPIYWWIMAIELWNWHKMFKYFFEMYLTTQNCENLSILENRPDSHPSNGVVRDFYQLLAKTDFTIFLSTQNTIQKFTVYS